MTFSPSDYYQLSQTYTASSANAFPASSIVNLEGTQSGIFSTAACSISMGGTTSATCASGSSWFDYSTTVGFTSLSTQGSSTNQWSATPLTYGLVAYLPFNGATSGTCTGNVLDLSGNGYTGICYGSPTYVSGKFGGALSFASASSQVVQLPTGGQWAPSTFSIAVWFKTSSATNQGFFGTTGPATISFYIQNNGEISAYFYDASSGFHSFSTSQTNYADGAWHQTVFVYDGSYLRIYVDGTQQATSASGYGPASGSTKAFVGWQVNNNYHMNGLLDDFRFYNCALSASEVSELYSSTVPVITFTDTTGDNIHTITYYDQFADMAQYSLNGGGVPTAPTLTGVSLGSTLSNFLTLTTSVQTVWLDAGTAWRTTNPSSNSWTTARWDSSAANGTTFSSATTSINPAYYNQYLYTLSYTISGGGSGYSAPNFTSTQFGGYYNSTLTTTPTGYWLDNSAICFVTNPLPGSGSTERWDTQTSCPTAEATTAGEAVVFTYHNQYSQTLSYVDIGEIAAMIVAAVATAVVVLRRKGSEPPQQAAA
jgi:hypothetical protein